MVYGIFWQRNQQGLGNRKGLPDFYVFIPALCEPWFIQLNNPIPMQKFAILFAIELKIGNNKLNIHQERVKNEIETGYGLYYVCHSLADVNKIFIDFGYDRVEIQ